MSKFKPSQRVLVTDWSSEDCEVHPLAGCHGYYVDEWAPGFSRVRINGNLELILTERLASSPDSE